jgi:uncharacterized protein (TIGR00730 family)
VATQHLDTPATAAVPTRSVAVFCGSSFGSSPAYRAAAAAVGVELASQSCRLVYGGGDVGLMGVVADAVMGAGGEAVGVIPEHLASLELAHDGLTDLEVVADMHERKARMAELAHGVIVLPGGFGTYEEMFEILTWNQLGIVSMPVVVVDVDGFYEPLMQMVRGAVAAGFMKPDHGALLHRVDTAADAVAVALAPAATFTPKWVV